MTNGFEEGNEGALLRLTFPDGDVDVDGDDDDDDPD